MSPRKNDGLTTLVHRSDECFNCGESKAAIAESRRKKDPIYCAIVDAEGDCSDEFNHHVFIKRTRVDLRAALTPEPTR